MEELKLFHVFFNVSIGGSRGYKTSTKIWAYDKNDAKKRIEDESSAQTVTSVIAC